MEYQRDEFTKDSFIIQYFTRTDAYVVKTKELHNYLDMNKTTGEVFLTNAFKRAYIARSIKECEELIKWFLEPTPIETIKPFRN